jgi:nitrite reductase (NO-forming)
MQKKPFFIYIYLVLFTSLLILSCGPNTSAEGDETTDNALGQLNVEAVTPDLGAGSQIYKTKCMVCHQENGAGIPGIFPPLANSNFLLKEKMLPLHHIMHGSIDSANIGNSPNTKKRMPKIELSDEEIKDVMNYILNSWGNKGGAVSLDDVAAARKK